MSRRGGRRIRGALAGATVVGLVATGASSQSDLRDRQDGYVSDWVSACVRLDTAVYAARVTVLTLEGDGAYVMSPDLISLDWILHERKIEMLGAMQGVATLARVDDIDPGDTERFMREMAVALIQPAASEDTLEVLRGFDFLVNEIQTRAVATCTEALGAPIIAFFAADPLIEQRP